MNFLTFTAPTWHSPVTSTCGGVLGFADRLQALCADTRDIRGSWFAIEVHLDDAITKLPRWFWHIHGLFTFSPGSAVYNEIVALANEWGARIDRHVKLGPARSTNDKLWTTKHNVKELVDYCDKSLTEPLTDLSLEICRKVSLAASSTQFASGELSAAPSNRLVASRLQEILDSCEAAHRAVGKGFHDIKALRDTLWQLRSLVEVEGSENDIGVSIPVGDAVFVAKELSELFPKFTRWLSRRVTDRELALKLSRSECEFTIAILAATHIRYLRSLRRVKDWKRIISLNRFYTAKLRSETATDRNTAKWFVRYHNNLYKRLIGDMLLGG